MTMGIDAVTFGVDAVMLAAAALGGAAAGMVAARCAQRCFSVRLHPAAAIASCVAIGLALVVRAGSSAYAAPLLAFGWAGVVISGIAGLGSTAVATTIGGAAGWGLMHLIWRASRGSLGYGDVRLGGYLGMHLGLGGIMTVFAGLLAGFALAALVGAIGIVALGRSTDHRFALGPSLVAGALTVIWWSMPTGLSV